MEKCSFQQCMEDGTEIVPVATRTKPPLSVPRFRVCPKHADEMMRGYPAAMLFYLDTETRIVDPSS